MKATHAALLLPVLAVLTGCPSPKEICRRGVDQVCERSFECQSAEVRASPQFQGAFGTSVDDCKEKLYANPTGPQGVQGIACNDVANDQMLCSNLGRPTATDFDLSKAGDCKDARAELACADYLAQLSDPSKAPASCGERCK